MNPKKSILLAINDAIIALDVEDLIQSHFDCAVTAFTILEAEPQLDIINPELVIVDCDINYPNVCSLLGNLYNRDVKLICFCTSKKQASELNNDMTEVLLKPFDNDELKDLISRILLPHNKLAAEEIASGP